MTALAQSHRQEGRLFTKVFSITEGEVYHKTEPEGDLISSLINSLKYTLVSLVSINIIKLLYKAVSNTESPTSVGREFSVIKRYTSLQRRNK